MTNRLILIDPFEQTVSFVESDGTSDSITDLIKCDLIDVVDLSIANLSWLKRKHSTYIIRTEDEDQDMVDSDLDLDRVKERITWHPEGFKVEPMMEFIPLS